MTTRQTCLFRHPAPPSALSVTTAEDSLSQDLSSSTVLKPSGGPLHLHDVQRCNQVVVHCCKTDVDGFSGYQRRLVSKPASPLLPTAEAICESEASKCAPMGPPSMYCYGFVRHYGCHFFYIIEYVTGETWTTELCSQM